ncbi:MAG TPA: hypothetical protein VFN88_02935 [Caulobacteraceae bacterium]|nr:hypothetical protein [Caulobacteraceae bacterium]
MDLILDRSVSDQGSFAEQLDRARRLLRKPHRTDATRGAVLAALVLALASITFVSVIVIAPQAPEILVKGTY